MKSYNLKVGKLYLNPNANRVILYPTKAAAFHINHTYAGHYPLRKCEDAGYEIAIAFLEPNEIAMVLELSQYATRFGRQLHLIKLLVEDRIGWMLYGDREELIKEWKQVGK